MCNTKYQLMSYDDALARCVFENMHLLWRIIDFIPEESDRIKIYQLTLTTYNNLPLHRVTKFVDSTLLKKIRSEHLVIFKKVILQYENALCVNIDPDTMCIIGDNTIDISHLKNLKHLILKKFQNMPMYFTDKTKLSTVEFIDVPNQIGFDFTSLPTLRLLHVNNCSYFKVSGNIRQLQAIRIHNTFIYFEQSCALSNNHNTYKNALSYIDVTNSTIAGISIKKLLSMVNHDISNILIVFSNSKKQNNNKLIRSIKYKVDYSHPNNDIRNYNYFLQIYNPKVFAYRAEPSIMFGHIRMTFFDDNTNAQRVFVYCSDEKITYPKDISSLITNTAPDFSKLNSKDYPFLSCIVFNCSMSIPNKIQWPENLKKLIFCHSFNQQLENLPPLLEYLYLGNRYNCPLPRLPDNLKVLRIGTDFDQEISDIPVSLEEIYVASDNIYSSGRNLPKNIHVVIE